MSYDSYKTRSDRDEAERGWRARNPAQERSYPPGCPDPDWCRGNGCWWDCQGGGELGDKESEAGK